MRVRIHIVLPIVSLEPSKQLIYFKSQVGDVDLKSDGADTVAPVCMRRCMGSRTGEHVPAPTMSEFKNTLKILFGQTKHICRPHV